MGFSSLLPSVGLWLAPWKSALTEQELGPRGLCAAPDEGLLGAVGQGGRGGGHEEEMSQMNAPTTTRYLIRLKPSMSAATSVLCFWMPTY